MTMATFQRKPKDTHSIIQARLKSSYASSQMTVMQQHFAKAKLVNSQPGNLMENYFYPCDEVIRFEKTLIKHSMVWDQAKKHRSQAS